MQARSDAPIPPAGLLPSRSHPVEESFLASDAAYLCGPPPAETITAIAKIHNVPTPASGHRSGTRGRPHLRTASMLYLKYISAEGKCQSPEAHFAHIFCKPQPAFRSRSLSNLCHDPTCVIPRESRRLGQGPCPCDRRVVRLGKRANPHPQREVRKEHPRRACKMHRAGLCDEPALHGDVRRSNK